MEMCNACGVRGGVFDFPGCAAERPWALGFNRVAVQNHAALRARICGGISFPGVCTARLHDVAASRLGNVRLKA